MAVVELLLPRTSDAMTEAVLSAWLVPDGSQVSKGDLVAEVETDKAMVEVAADSAGLLVAAVAAGATVQVGGVLAYVLDGDDIEAHRSGRIRLGGSVPAHEVAAPASAVASSPALTTVTAPVPMGNAVGVKAPVFASPLARRLAREQGLRLEDLTPGSGPGGRVVREDILRQASKATADRVGQLSSRQRSMVTAMISAKSEIPHFYLFREIDLTTLLSHRRHLKAAGLHAPSVSVFVIKALGIALAERDYARRIWRDGQPVDLAEGHVGIAVADGDGEIVVPVVKAPVTLTIDAIGEEVSRLSEAVRQRSLRQAEMTGAVATISNLGMYGIDALLPIIPPGQSFIIGVGRDRAELFLDDLERVRSRSMATFGFSGDHRVLTGVGGARLLEHLEHLLQHPLALAATSQGHPWPILHESPTKKGTRNE